jgi:hypothetical protein
MHAGRDVFDRWSAHYCSLSQSKTRVLSVKSCDKVSQMIEFWEKSQSFHLQVINVQIDHSHSSKFAYFEIKKKQINDARVGTIRIEVHEQIVRLRGTL